MITVLHYLLKVLLCINKNAFQSVADPGFPLGGGTNSPVGGGVPTYDFAKISRKLLKIERIWTPSGEGHFPRTPLNPPMPIGYLLPTSVATNKYPYGGGCVHPVGTLIVSDKCGTIKKFDFG